MHAHTHAYESAWRCAQDQSEKECNKTASDTYLDATGFGEQQIVTLDVTMNDTPLVKILQTMQRL
jgi:hypothetical protein